MENGMRRIDDPEYLAGQIAGLAAAIVGIANITTSKTEFLAQVRERIESSRTAIVFSPTSDNYLQGLNDMERFFRALA